ncbi:MAG: iron export ABC transporter permease subunit FetB [Clostridia bacterium]|nr:iron export ABC transporter permease subunit FetB [Clostridia bacterium]
MDKIINLGMWQLVAAYIFIVLLLFIVKIRGIAREKEILISTVRMTLQLMLTGYILAYIFQQSNPIFTIIVIIIMEVFAVHNTFKRVKSELSPKLKRIIALSLVGGSLISLVYFLLIVIRISPWYDPRYFIPIAGMIVGNSMTGVSLGIHRLVEGMNTQKHLIESALMLGATPKMAARQVANNAFDSAILPTINSMVGMGIVSLPGMMTGQILSGTSPLVAIEYQIAIMLGICGSVSLTVIMAVQMGYKTFFTERSQLNI